MADEVKPDVWVDEPFGYGTEQLVNMGSTAFETGWMTLHLSDSEEPELELELYVKIRNIPALIAALTRARQIAEGWAAEAEGGAP